MTGSISSFNGLPPDAVPPIQPIVPGQGVDKDKKEPPDQLEGGSADPEVTESHRLARQKTLEIFRKQISDKAKEEGGFTEWL